MVFVGIVFEDGFIFKKRYDLNETFSDLYGELIREHGSITDLQISKWD